jgi:glycosyltransferase involved in cell wall biosynthesis
MDSGAPTVTILMPVKNEGLNLTIMLKILRAVVDVPHEVLVVFDHPDDNSADVVRTMTPDYPVVRAIHNTLGPGVLNAFKAGVAAARGKYVLIFAADEVGPVLAVDDMLALMESGCEFVSCTRYAHGGRRLGGSWIGGILSRTANWMFCRLSHLKLSDATTGVKIFRPQLLDRFPLESRVGWAFAFELSIKAQLAGLRLGEVPVVSIDRLYGGESSFALGSWTAEYLRWFIWGLKQTMRAGKKQTPRVMVRIPMATAISTKEFAEMRQRAEAGGRFEIVN